ncbi:MAG: GTPase Era [Actinomycetota bacterium]
MSPAAPGAPFRSGLVALAGRPNVGKSTLANALAGVHVAAVSPRPQTTRRRVSAVVHGDGFQAVLLDLPGFQRPADRLTERMQRTVDDTLADCDAAVLVLNAREAVGGGDRFIAERLRAAGLPVIVVVNQVDRVDAAGIARAIEVASPLVEFTSLHPVSALTGDGVAALRADLPAILPEGPAYFPPGLVTDQTEEELAGEIVREAALQRIREEVPHAIAVAVEEVAEAGPRGRERVVRAAILVERESQKAIVVGKGGAMIRSIGIASRTALSRIWGTTVHVDLVVKVRRRWRQDESMLDRLGL